MLLDLKCFSPEKIPGGSIPEIDKLIEYYNCATFGASSPKNAVLLMKGSNGTKPLPLAVKDVPLDEFRMGSIDIKDVVIFLQSSNDTHPLPLSLNCVPPGRILDGSIPEIDNLIEYYHCAKFGASSPKNAVLLPKGSNGTDPPPPGCKRCPPGRIQDGSMAEINQPIE